MAKGCYRSRVNEIAVEAVRGVLGAHAAVSFAVLFGSLAAGRGRPDSDADIGVGCAVGQTMALSERFDLALELERVLGREIDLVVLDEATPLLRLEAAQGDCIYERERWVFGDFVAAALLEFDDIRPHLLRCGRSPLGKKTPSP